MIKKAPNLDFMTKKQTGRVAEEAEGSSLVFATGSKTGLKWVSLREDTEILMKTNDTQKFQIHPYTTFFNQRFIVFSQTIQK